MIRKSGVRFSEKIMVKQKMAPELAPIRPIQQKAPAGRPDRHTAVSRLDRFIAA
jgi:hypothetical protein